MLNFFVLSCQGNINLSFDLAAKETVVPFVIKLKKGNCSSICN